MVASGIKKLVNVDGNLGKDVIPFPHSGITTPAARKYDHMTVADRIEQVRNEMTPNERACAESFVLLCSGGTLETTSMYEFLHWWALCEYNYEGLINYLVHYKFKKGQSSFAIRFFEEALSTGNLTYAFNSPVACIKEGSQGVQLDTRDGRSFKANKMICAIPLNVLSDVKFDPPLSPGKSKAASTGHINQCVKVHAEIAEKELRSMTGMSYPHNNLIYGFGDGTTPAGNTHVVAFGAQHNHFHPEDDVQTTIGAFQGFAPMTVQRLVRRFRYESEWWNRTNVWQVFHNWSRDEFAKGAW